MRDLGVPKQNTRWLETKFRGRTTTLSFEDFESEPFDIKHGLDQGCPLSPILFNFYTAKLLQTTNGKDELAASFVDDVFNLTIAGTVEAPTANNGAWKQEKEDSQSGNARTHAK